MMLSGNFMPPSTYDILNKAWKSTCRALIGGEVGELDDFSAYLRTYSEDVQQANSILSEKQITISDRLFSKGASFISNDELEAYAKSLSARQFRPGDIKDIDSLLSAAQEMACYSGNIVKGNSSFVEDANSVSDSFYVYRSFEVFGSKYVAYSCNSRLDEYMFGGNWSGESKFIINCSQTYRQTRCMETMRTFTSADCYYTANLEGCADCFFCFNQRSKRHMMGNLQLSQADYSKKKSELVSQLRDIMKAKKRAPTLIEVMNNGNGP